MKIAAFYSDSPFAGWVQAEGFVDVLKRMGHDVTAIAVPPVTKITQADADLINHPIDDCELVIVSGPEHLRKWIQAFYPNWGKLKAARIAWYHESFVREDYSLDYAHFEKMFDYHFFPDKNDAEKYKGDWLPLGVDTEMFHLQPGWDRTIDVGFIGLMYPKRARLVEELQPHLGDIKIRMRYAWQSERGLMPAIGAYDWNGLNVRLSMQLLANAYNQIKVFVTFPSLSNVLVAKTLESLACGCVLVAPQQPCKLEHYIPYEGAYLCAEAIRVGLHAAAEQPKRAAKYIHQHHRMELRFKEIFKKVGVAECVSA